MAKKIFFLFIYVWTLPIIAQVQGHIMHAESKAAIPFANIRWKMAQSGSVSDTSGHFSIGASSYTEDTLIISMVGFQTQYFPNPSGHIMVHLSPAGLAGVVVSDSRSTMVVNEGVGMQSVITEAGLKKSACCNLAEAFETNGAVDISFSDAISGVKQVKLLGLDGKYVPVNFEGLPHLRGISSLYGLSYIPGPFIAAIQVSKGPGSVTLGNESMTGHMNVEFKKPREMERLHLNGFVNMLGRGELNLISAHKINPAWSTALFVHGNIMRTLIDRNKDGFLDMPLAHQVNVQNRWYYEKGNTEWQFGAKYLYDSKEGGQSAYFRKADSSAAGAYAFQLQTQRAEAWFKNGYLFDRKPYRSFAWMGTAAYHNQKGKYGARMYAGNQATAYVNTIYQDIISNTNHSYKAGFSFLYDRVGERFGNTSFYREEYIPGVYAEYKYSYPEKLSVIVGLRYDYNSLFGNQITPRFHLRYDPVKEFTMKFTAGRGYRSPAVFSDNAAVLVSNRMVQIEALKPEVSWNGGGGMTYSFDKNRVNGSLTLDYFYTYFENQLIPDMESQGLVYFRNLANASYSHAVQMDFMIEPLRRLQFHLNAKYNKVVGRYNGVQKDLPFIPQWRGLINAAYKTKGVNYWAFDITLQVNGPARLPKTYDPSTGLFSAERSAIYPLLFAQVTKKIKKWELYIGGENLTDYRQKNPIIDAPNPNSAHFDASQVWAPVYGAMVYGGFRYIIK